MRVYKIIALIRASSLAAASYRLNLLISMGWLVVSVVPLYFVSGAIQPLIGDKIQTEGGEYFAFVLIGMISIAFLTTAITALPTALGSSISTGLFEALMGTSTPLPVVFAGLTGYGVIWTSLRALVLVVVGVAFGAHFVWERTLVAAGILALTFLAYFSVGIIAAALVLAFRTTGPLPKLALSVSALLGGVYYPTKVIPSWIQEVSDWIPLTYGLRALRQTVLEGMPFHAVAHDVAVLAAFVVVLGAGSTYLFYLAFRHARRSGTLSQY